MLSCKIHEIFQFKKHSYPQRGEEWDEFGSPESRSPRKSQS